MRYLKLIILLIISCWSTIVLADDYTLCGENIKVENGTQTAVVNIYMTNVETISALQFDITLPDGIDVYYGINSDDEESYFINKGERAKTTQSITFNKLEEHCYRIMISSSSNATFKETDANKVKPVATITLDLSEAKENYTNVINISNIVFSHYIDDTFSSQPYYPYDSQFSVTVGSPFTIGDINGDDLISISDVAELISYLNGGTPLKFIESAADVNDDNIIDVNDVQALGNLILGKKNSCDYEYVDLGLSVKWATCNVGANSPEEYGNYFAWGETTGYNEGKTTFDWSTYTLCDGSNTTMTRYCTSSDYDTVDNKTVLDSTDDAATVNWGGNWRMPTDAEFTELRTSCTWTWTTQNGVNGYKVTGTNGNFIFLPAAGYRNNSDLSNAGSYGRYWSSSLNSSNSYDACIVFFYSSNVGRGDNGGRCYGRTVRAVCP